MKVLLENFYYKLKMLFCPPPKYSFPHVTNTLVAATYPTVYIGNTSVFWVGKGAYHIINGIATLLNGRRFYQYIGQFGRFGCERKIIYGG